MSDESTKDSNQTVEPGPADQPVVGPGELQHIRTVRHWRQKYLGPEADYVYRKSITVHCKKNTTRRVQGGERVDCERDGITARRLKAMWYAQVIELADPTAVIKARPKKNIVDNAAARREEARLRAEEERKLAEKRELRRAFNAKIQEEAEQRRLAEIAVRAAEDAERQEIEDLIQEEERAKLQAKVDKQLAKRTKKRAEEALKEAAEAEEQAEFQKEQAAVAQEREAQAKQEAAEELAKRELESRERAEAREAELNKHRIIRDGSQNDPKPLTNPDNKKLSAEEAKAAVKDFN